MIERQYVVVQHRDRGLGLLRDMQEGEDVGAVGIHHSVQTDLPTPLRVSSLLSLRISWMVIDDTCKPSDGSIARQSVAPVGQMVLGQLLVAQLRLRWLAVYRTPDGRECLGISDS